MTEILLIRHAVNEYVKTGKLAGWTPGVHLNDEGKAQAEALGRRLADTRIDALYSSPLERTVETAQAVLAHHPHLQLTLLEDIGEVRYGEWQGAELAKLYRRKNWLMVQAYPSRMRFPGGETMRQVQLRAVDALERLVEYHPRQRVAVVSHADVIKLVLAHYMGIHIDLFQRLNISPASLSVLSLGFGRVMIGQMNETSYLPPPPKSDGLLIEISAVSALVVDAVGEPGSRVFYLQAQHADGQYTTLHIEKTQALQLADEIDALFAAGLAAASPDELGVLLDPQPVLFRGGRFALKYEDDSDLVMLEMNELLGVDQGTPRVLRLWLTRPQLRAVGVQSRQVAERGRQSD